MVKPPQSNAFIERVHQVLRNMLRSKSLIEAYEKDVEDPWSDVLASVGWEIRSPYHTTLEASPAQLIYGRDMIFPLQYKAEWEFLRTRKQDSINKSNRRENNKRVEWTYKVGDKVLLGDKDNQRKLDYPTKGPFVITKVHDKINITIQRGVVKERLNIRRVKPYHE